MNVKPLLIVNFKNYPEVAGEKAIDLAQKIASISSQKWDIAIAPPLLYLTSIASKTKNQLILAQHTDYQDYGAFTGYTLPAEIKRAGAAGTLLNHSERKLLFPILEKTITACKKEKLLTIVCAASLEEVERIASLRPEYIAYEPPELIGTEISVTSAKPEIVTKVVQQVRKISPATFVLCGAGIHKPADIAQALVLGAKGVLIGHAIPKAKDPAKALKEFLV